MNNILLIGKLNDIIRDLHSYLSEYFQVQLCSENASVAEGMLKIAKPDLAIINSSGAYETEPAIFSLLGEHYKDIPVIVIGGEEERQHFEEFAQTGQFEHLLRPVKNSEIYEVVCRRLNIVNRLAEEEKARQAAKKHILVVDDNGTTLRTVKAMLEEKYEVSIAISGTQAMTSIGKKRPDLILLDYEMPVCDGRMTLEMIRADEDLKDIPVIFLTGVNSREHINAVLELKPAGYYLKPPVKEVLIERIEEVLNNG
ncbi:MAG: response regulator [Butyrivibrio sp.]|nr:response regulator [Muribaculum sp.]MCM1552394.1 response regulator [Butyrivibrio sp.]